MAENTLSVLKIAPGQYPQQVEIDNDLKALQEAVGGSMAQVTPFEDPVAIVYNDDGKLMGLPLNRALRDENGEMYDAVAGTFLVVGLGEEDFASLTPEMAQKYEQLFHQPEAFLKLYVRWCCRCRMNLPQKSPAPSLRQSMTAKIPCCTGGDGSAGRNRTEVIQHYDLHHKAVRPDCPAGSKSGVSAVPVQSIPRQAERPHSVAAKPGRVQRGDQQNRHPWVGTLRQKDGIDYAIRKDTSRGLRPVIWSFSGPRTQKPSNRRSRSIRHLC